MSKKPPSKLCVMDISTLRVAVPASRDGQVEVRSALNEVVLAADLEAVSASLAEAASNPGALLLELLDRVLAHGVVLREDAAGEVAAHAVALLNPFSKEIAVGPLPRTLAFPFDGACPAAGFCAELDDGTLRIDATAVAPRAMSRRDLASAAAAHSM